MTLRDELLTVLRGERAERVPFTIYKWLVPDRESAWRLQREMELTLIDAAPVYIDRHQDVALERREFTQGGKRKALTRITTAVGELTELVEFEPSFGSPWVTKHFIENVDDLRIMTHVLGNTLAEPHYPDYFAQDAAMGERGIVLGAVQPVPVAWMWVQLMGAEVWSEMLIEHTEEFDELHEALLAGYRRQIDIAAESPAEVIWLPDNVTASMVSPKTFAHYCVPAYDYACTTLRQAGKRTFAHYDGSNRPLRNALAQTGIDVIEAFTPPPMGDMTVAEAREAWPDKVLCVNFPESLYGESAARLEAQTRVYLEQAGDAGRFCIGCTEDFDPALFEHAFGAIGRVLSETRSSGTAA